MRSSMLLVVATELMSASTAAARTVESAAGVSFEVPESYTVSTLGGCDRRPVAVISTTGSPLPLLSLIHI